jgi:hypothetical protein
VRQPSGVTSKPAIRGHFKTGHMEIARNVFLHEPEAGSRAPAQRAFIARPLTPRTAHHSYDLTKRELRLTCPFFRFLCLSSFLPKKFALG